MAEIWLARQPGVRGFEKLVVIKRMVGALEEDPDHVEMFLTEARLAAQLTHPHIVQVYELGEEDGSFFIVMEFVDGESLWGVYREARRQEKPLSDQLAARLIAWSAEGLHYAHTRTSDDGTPLCIVHRDVSPQNLLVTMDGTIKLVDFGIAKVASHATSSGKLKGKLAYMAPEQGRAEAVDARSDVFALGVCLFELVTRTRLFPRMNELEILTKITTSLAFARASERRPDVSPVLDEIIARAMAAFPENRYQSARELQVALDDWLVSTGARTTSGDVADFMRVIFAERIATRKNLIEAAKRGELTPGQIPTNAFTATSESGSSSVAKGARSSGLYPAVKPAAPAAEEVSLSFDATARLPLPVPSRPPVAGHATHAPTPSPFPEAPPELPKGSRGPLPFVLAAVALAFVAVVGWFAMRSAQAELPAVVDAGTPVAASATLAVVVTPADALVRIDGASRGASPFTLAAGEHTIEVDAAGLVPEKRTVRLASGERLEVVLKLEHLPVVEASPDPTTVKKPEPVAVKTAKGTLKLDTVPWTTVFLGGKKLGDTPLLGISLPAGRHTLRLVNSEQNLEHTIEVDIVANQATVKRLKLQ